MAKDPTKQPLDFKAMITEGADLWREWRQPLDTIERCIEYAAGDREMLKSFQQAVRHLVDERRLSVRQSMRTRFGIDLVPASYLASEQRLSFPDFREVDPDRARPKTLLDAAEQHDLLVQHMTLETAGLYMGHAAHEAWVARHARDCSNSWWNERYQRYRVHRENDLPYPPEAALGTFVYVMRNAPVALYAALATEGESRSEAQRLQEAALGAVAAAVRSEIRLYPELREALSEQGRPGEVLIQELPAAVLAELADLDHLRRDADKRVEILNELAQKGMYKILRNKTANRLRTSRGDASRSWELHEESAQAGEIDSELEDFERHETLRQQRQQLDHLLANLSPQQGEIFDRWRVGMKIKDIAAELGIPEKQVSVQKHYTMKKLSQAREASGF